MFDATLDTVTFDGDGRPPTRHSPCAPTRQRLALIQRTHEPCVPTWIFSILHVGISKYPRGKGKFSTWGRNETSEESNDMSEEFFLAYVENKKYPRGDLKISTWRFV